MKDTPKSIRTNHIVLASRCEYSRAKLGLSTPRVPGTPAWPSVTMVFAQAAHTGWINDAVGGPVHLDIYSPEMYKLAEPMRDQIGACWYRGLDALSSDLARLVHPEGLVTWGRSTAVLSAAMSLDFATMVLAFCRRADTGLWLDVADAGLTAVADCLDRGLVTTYRVAGTEVYRGPRRRLQLSLDIVGKVLDSAIRLQNIDLVNGNTRPWPPIHRVVQLPDLCCTMDAPFATTQFRPTGDVRNRPRLPPHTQGSGVAGAAARGSAALAADPCSSDVGNLRRGFLRSVFGVRKR